REALSPAGEEVGRYYSFAKPAAVTTARIRVGAPFLDVGSEFEATHPELTKRLQKVGHHPKPAHRGDDLWLLFRRWKTWRTHQIAEGLVVHADSGPFGDPDWVWNIDLDQFYDSEDGFRLPNEKNRVKHSGLHVEACKSLSRERLKKDGLRATHKTVPEGKRVWMLGTYVFDDAWDFGSPDHEHFELHPLYVMEPSMGGWFHFVTFESIALVRLARKIQGVPPRSWPWTSEDPQDYEKQYLTMDPQKAMNELATSYRILYKHFKGSSDSAGLIRFFVAASLRYDSYGVDSGLPGSPTAADYRKWAKGRIDADRWSHIREAITNRVIAMYHFLYGRPSYALHPVQGPAPQSLLRCVYAMEHSLAAAATGGKVGEANPRIGLNRATSRKVLPARKELGDLYAALFAAVADPARRAGLFADAAIRYRNWGVLAGPATKSMGLAALKQFALTATPETLVREMRARVNKFWDLLTPFRRK
ncbi:MAG: hypothetical protein GY953_56675, partial [bacterium]|nr:hypothetical protein [bacterium]